ncbi:heterogeneous nuclear ribonucleoprotein L-like isoform X1 [Pecten maximus]|uniref:heterogeneous nuclear ribonucleoprotein L-like isoform X1 n=1 Tax=Pecten maximus TaxID=6579 RepID=UPI00145815AE|nr:heterogeneous nuclear ribonucleoprotein L-like isoform X1 [Pecten maximus]
MDMASGYDGHISKRQRTEDGRGEREDPHKPSPSPVVHVRNLSEATVETDLVHAVQHFGTVSYVIMMPKKRQALIEFEDIESATSCVTYAANNAIYVRSQVALFNFSTSQRIQRPGGPDDNRIGNHILLFTILRPEYPITVDVMHTICSPYGEVQRIVIFKKHGVQAMVEFENTPCAKRAKEALNGADVYSGCCTLKIEFAKPTKLNVVRNDPEYSWDYTNPTLGKDMNQPPQRNAPLLQNPRYSSGPTPFNAGSDPQGMGPSGGYGTYVGNDTYEEENRRDHGHGHGHSHQGMASSGGYGMYDHGDAYGGYGAHGGPSRQHYGHEMQQDRFAPKPPPQEPRGYGRGPPHSQGGYQDQGMMNPGGPGQGGASQGAVLMVYGLNMEKVNCDKLFNLFCLYGNVVRIKFLKSKEGAAMVQLGDSMAVDRALQNLNNTFFFGNKMQLGPSKQAFLQDVPNPHDLVDGTCSFKDYMGNRNNRFTNPESASKNRIQTASKILHYFNAPPNITNEDIEQIFENSDAPKPPKIKQFPTKSDRSSTGLVEFETKAEATEALLLTNHTSVPNPSGKNPYVFKLCFSATPIQFS